MGGTDASATADHRFDLALKSSRAPRPLLLYVRTNLGQASLQRERALGDAKFQCMVQKSWAAQSLGDHAGVLHQGHLEPGIA